MNNIFHISRKESIKLPAIQTKFYNNIEDRNVMYVVYVLSKTGKTLMPTKRFRKVRLLLKNKLAKVVQRKPFTIQLLYDTNSM